MFRVPLKDLFRGLQGFRGQVSCVFCPGVRDSEICSLGNFRSSSLVSGTEI